MESKTNYKYKFTVLIKQLEFTIPYEADLSVKLLRGNKSTESKTRVHVNSESDRTINIQEPITLVSTLEYNPKLG